MGQTEQTLGEHERNYIRGGHDALIAPLSRFLDTEMKNIMRERKILENKRLDLDVCKNKVRKARAMQLQPPVSSRKGGRDQFPSFERKLSIFLEF